MGSYFTYSSKNCEIPNFWKNDKYPLPHLQADFR